jgi:hypothetical protein
MGLAVAAVLALAGCKRAHPQSTREAINGAFGWALGARLPAAFDVQTNSGGWRYLDPRGNVPPFNQVMLELTTNRTIWAITGTLSAASLDACQDLEKSLKASLAKKYPFEKQASEGGISRTHYGEAGREVILAMATQPPTLALCFRARPWRGRRSWSWPLQVGARCRPAAAHLNQPNKSEGNNAYALADDF